MAHGGVSEVGAAGVGGGGKGVGGGATRLGAGPLLAVGGAARREAVGDEALIMRTSRGEWTGIATLAW